MCFDFKDSISYTAHARTIRGSGLLEDNVLGWHLTICTIQLAIMQLKLNTPALTCVL